MTILDILLTLMSFVCFAIAFLIASRPISKAKFKRHAWNEANDEQKPTIEIFTAVSEETQ